MLKMLGWKKRKMGNVQSLSKQLGDNDPPERRPSEDSPVRHTQKKRRRRQSSAHSTARGVETRSGPSSSSVPEDETGHPPPKRRSVDLGKEPTDDTGELTSDDEEMAPVPILNFRRPKTYSPKFSNRKDNKLLRGSSQSLPALRSLSSSPTATGLRSFGQPTTSTICITSDSPGPSRRATDFLFMIFTDTD
ncbi:hypothetical protein FRB99_008924 [Tulasnella sp. 403]|nr:hypothetical protein FRB99_008924 [Tulasnella sp. 403]